MALNNYANLKAAIRDKSHRNDMTDDRIDDFIDLAEADIWQKLRIRDMDTRATASASTSDRYLALPDSFIKMRNLTTVVGGVTHQIKYVVPASMRVKTGSGRPRFFTVTSQLEFDRVPDSAYVLEMQYFKKETALSDTNTTNAVLTNFPNIYFYAILKHLYDWTEQPEMELKYELKFEKEIVQSNKQDKKDGYGPAPQMRIEGATP